MKDVKSILLIGVGGQGTILVSKVITCGLMRAGYDVKMSEIHGMAQRGGSVSTQIRYGEKVYSPIIGKGEADILVAFETMEAVRGAEYLKPDGIAVINNYEIAPMPVAAGRVPYPEGLLKAMQDKFKVYAFDAGEKAKELGNPRTMNIVLLGAMVEAFQMNEIDWEAALRDTVPPAFVDVNLVAFNAGRSLVK